MGRIVAWPPLASLPQGRRDVERGRSVRYRDPMATPRSRRAARHRARRQRAQHRARRLAVIGIVTALALVTLILTAFGSGAPERASTTVPAPALAIGVPPEPVILATVGNLRIRLPIAADAVTAIGFYRSDTSALELGPVGRQANEGLLARLWRRLAGSAQEGPVWYQLSGGPGTEVLVVGAAPGTDAYSPVDGTVVSIADFVIDGEAYGSRIDVRPSASPSVIVSLSHLEPDPSLAVGSPVLSSSSKLGSVVDVAAVERQALARHGGARGNNVSIEVHPAAGSLP